MIRTLFIIFILPSLSYSQWFLKHQQNKEWVEYWKSDTLVTASSPAAPSSPGYTSWTDLPNLKLLLNADSLAGYNDGDQITVSFTDWSGELVTVGVHKTDPNGVFPKYQTNVLGTHEGFDFHIAPDRGGFEITDKSKINYFHQNSMTLVAIFYLNAAEVTGTTIRKLFFTAGAATQIGIEFGYRMQDGSANEDLGRLYIIYGTSGQRVAFTYTSNKVNYSDWNYMIASYDNPGDSIVVNLNGTETSAVEENPPSASAATNTASIGNIALETSTINGIIHVLAGTSSFMTPAQRDSLVVLIDEVMGN